jgi:type IV fimbrial biogenesis protein FimT
VAVLATLVPAFTPPFRPFVALTVRNPAWPIGLPQEQIPASADSPYESGLRTRANQVNTQDVDCRNSTRTSGSSVGSHGNASGFTLIELLTVVAIVAILAASASGGFQRFIVAARISEGSSAFRSALELARSEAAIRGVRVGVCRSTNANDAGGACSQEASGNIAGRDWSAGWIVYAKAPANNADTFEAGDIVIRRQASLSSTGLTSRLTIWAPGDGAIVYNWNGMRVAGPVGGFALDFGAEIGALPASLSSDQARCMVINVAGRIDVTAPVSGSCP